MRVHLKKTAALIYDHDGTLVDSLAVVVESTNATLLARGLPACQPEAIIKGMAYATLPRMGLHAGTDDPQLQAELAREFYVHMHRLPQLCRLYPGVAELLAGVKARGLPQALVSNNSGTFIRAAIGHLGYTDHFAAAIGEDDAPAPKPDPRGALLAAARCGVDPTACLFVGDSPADRNAGHGAGMRTIGVTWGIHTRSEMLDMGFDVLIDQPAELLALL